MNIIELMYVDDDYHALKMFSNVVNSLISDKVAQIRLSTFKTGEEITSALKNKPNENRIVFLDIDMPGKNGFQVLKEIRAKKDLNALPVIMYSSGKDKISVDISYDLGANLYIIKPNSSAELMKILQKVIQHNFRKPQPDFTDFILNP